MNPLHQNPSFSFHRERWLNRRLTLCLLSLTTFARGVDYNYGEIVPQTVTVTATSHARALGDNISIFSDNGLGSLYSRTASRDVTFLRFDLSRLSNLTLAGDATLRLPAWSQFGDGLNNGVLNQINSPWTYTQGGAVPAYAPIADSAPLTGSFTTGSFANWTISQNTIQNIQSNLGSFYGFALTADAGSQLHFNGLAQLSVDADVADIRIVDAVDWSAATFDENNKVLNVAGTSNVSGGSIFLGPFTTLSIADSATLDNGSFSGTLDTNNGNFIFGSSANQTLSGNITGIGFLNKTNTGTLTLSGSNSLLGEITVSGGTLSLASSESITRQNNVVIENGGVLSNDVPAGAALTLGTITLRGGTLAATAPSTFAFGNFPLLRNITAEGTQPSTISADVRVGNNEDRVFFIAPEATLNVTGRLGHYSGASWGYFTKTGDGTMKVSGPLEVGGLTVSQGKLILEDAAAGWEMNNRNITNNATLEFLTNSGTRTMPRNLTGNGEVIKSGAGTLALTGPLTYTGNTTVNAGVLSIGDGTSTVNLSNLSTITIASGAQMNLNFTGSDVVAALTLNNAPMPSGTYNATSHPEFFTGTGSITVVGFGDGVWASSVNSDWDVAGSWQNNTIANGSGYTATFNGAEGTTINLLSQRLIGNLSFSARDYAITNAAQTLVLDSASTSTIDVETGRTATISSRLFSVNSVTKAGGGRLYLDAGPTDNYSGVYNHVSNGLTVTGGTVELASQYFRFGTINIENGATLRTIAPWALGSSNPWFSGRSAGTIAVQAGGTLTSTTIANAIVEGITLYGGSVTSTNVSSADWGAFVLASRLSADGETTSTISAEMTIAGNQTIDVAFGSDLLISGILRNRYATTGGINKTGPGTLVLTGENVYTGPTLINEGILKLGDGATNGSAALSNITNNAELVLHPAGNITWNQSISGFGTLKKLGNNSVTVTAAQNYIGNTIVEEGTLSLQNNSNQVMLVNLVNSNFEAPDYSSGNWSYLNGDGVTNGWSINSGGIASQGSPWFSATPPNGDQAAFLQNNATMSQTITVTTAGTYNVSFFAANRPGYNASNLSIRIDSNVLGSWSAAQLASNGNFVARSTSTITLQPGTYTLVFEATQVGEDSATIIDNVVISEPVVNGSLFFEVLGNGENNQLLGSGTAVINGLFQLDLSNAVRTSGNAWTLVNHASLNESYGPNFRLTSGLGNFVSNGDNWTLTNNSEVWTFQESTGVLTLNIVEDPFLSWMNGFFPNETNPAIVGPTADPDQDGIVNLLEFVLDGGNPNESNQGILPTLDASGANFVFTFRRRAETASVTSQTFQYGTNLTGWTDLSIAPSTEVVITPNTPSNGVDQVTITIPKGTNTKMFGRLRVSELVN